MALITYEAQVDFTRRWLKEGRCERVGRWSGGGASGDMWIGRMGIWVVRFETLGRMMRVGSFRVSVNKNSPPQHKED